VAILGGAKISGKIDVLRVLLGKVDRLLVGGAMMFTFMRAQGRATGRSLVEEDRVEMAREVLAQPPRAAWSIAPRGLRGDHRGRRQRPVARRPGGSRGRHGDGRPTSAPRR